MRLVRLLGFSASFLFVATVILGWAAPAWFQPSFTVKAAPSGRAYRLMSRRPVAVPGSDAKALSLRYWAESLREPERLGLEAGDLMEMLRSEADEGNYDLVLVEAFEVTGQLGPFARGETRTTVFKRPPGRWTDSVSPLAPKPRSRPVDAGTRRLIERLYAAAGPQLRGRKSPPGALVSSEVTIQSMALEDGELVVRSTQMLMTRLRGPRGPLSVRTETKCRDTWVRAPPSWRIRLSEDLETKTTFLN